MSELLDDGPDMTGLAEDLWYTVPESAQREIVRAFPELRLLWNPVLEQYQCVHEEPGHFQKNYGTNGLTIMCNWVIIPGNYSPPLDVDRVVRQLRARAELAERATAEHGGICALAEKLSEELIQRRKKAESDKFDDFFGMNSETGYVSALRPGVARSRAYGGRPAYSRPEDLPVAPAWLQARAFAAKGPGKKELLRRAKRLDASLRMGVPL